MLTFGSLFAGQGGFELGLEAAGMKCRWQVECNEYALKILKKHFPCVRRHSDVRTFLNGWDEKYNEPFEIDLTPFRVDVICGGFPCQDVSRDGKREGITGPRSGLWKEFRRVIRILQPRVVIVENVTGLLDGGIGVVLGDLAEIGFDAEWDCLPASAFGAYHERDRVFIVAYRPFQHRDTRGVLEACGDWGPLLQSRRLYCMAVAQRGQRKNVRLECEPRLARLVDGVPNRTQRLHLGGNAVYPPAAQWLGERVIEWFQEHLNRVAISGSTTK